MNNRAHKFPYFCIFFVRRSKVVAAMRLKVTDVGPPMSYT